jgi:hypothetical protein
MYPRNQQNSYYFDLVKLKEINNFLHQSDLVLIMRIWRRIRFRGQIQIRAVLQTGSGCFWFQVRIHWSEVRIVIWLRILLSPNKYIKKNLIPTVL